MLILPCLRLFSFHREFGRCRLVGSLAVHAPQRRRIGVFLRVRLRGRLPGRRRLKETRDMALLLLLL